MRLLNVKETFLNLYTTGMVACDWIKLLRLRKTLTLHSVEVSSSPNLPLLFVIAFWRKTNRSSLSQLFFKIGVFKTFANFVGKHQCWGLFLLKETPTQVLSCKIFEIFKNTLFCRTHLVAASEQTQEILVVCCLAKWYFIHLAQVYLGCSISC